MRPSRFSPIPDKGPARPAAASPGPRFALRRSQQIRSLGPRHPCAKATSQAASRDPPAPNRRTRTNAVTTRRPRPTTAPPDYRSRQAKPNEFEYDRIMLLIVVCSSRVPTARQDSGPAKDATLERGHMDGSTEAIISAFRPAAPSPSNGLTARASRRPQPAAARRRPG